MTPWQLIQATTGPLARVYLHMVMGDEPHLPEGGGGTDDHRWIEYAPSKGVRIVDQLSDRTTPYTSWRALEKAVCEHVDAEPLRAAYDTERAAWRAYLVINDEWLDTYVRETAAAAEVRVRLNAAHTAWWPTEQALLNQLRAAIANPEPSDLLDLLGETA